MPTAPFGPTARRRIRSSPVATCRCSTISASWPACVAWASAGFVPSRVAIPSIRERMITGYRLHLSGRFDRLPLRSPRKADRLNSRAYAHTLRTAKGTCFRSHTSEMFGFVRVDEISSVGVEPVYDIEVAGHHNFVADGLRGPQLRSRLPPQPRGSRGAGHPVLRHGHRAARVPRSGQAVLRFGHPRRRQQVRRARTPRCGAVGRSSTSRRASTARCRCRRTSASTARTPVSSSAR